MNSQTRSFEHDVPHAPLSPIWDALPVGHFRLKVVGVTDGGDPIGLAGVGDYARAAPFDGPYHHAVLPYERSGRLALERVLHKDFVQHWLTHGEPDPSYMFYRHPAKVLGALISGAVTYAGPTAGTGEAERAQDLAVMVSGYLLSLSFPAGDYLEYFPPAYHGAWLGNDPSSHMQLTNYLIIAAARPGMPTSIFTISPGTRSTSPPPSASPVLI